MRRLLALSIIGVIVAIGSNAPKGVVSEKPEARLASLQSPPLRGIITTAPSCAEDSRPRYGGSSYLRNKRKKRCWRT